MLLALLALLPLGLIACGGKGSVTDADGDGFWSDVDCDDGDPALYPAADERCDGVDNDCDGDIDELAADAVTWSVDSDGDGYGEPSYTVASCTQPDGYAPSAGDCDDTNDAVFPGAAEQCDGVDDDCDGLVDDADPSLNEATVTVWYPDVDLDGYGDGASEGMAACADPSTPYAPYASNDEDCDDSTGAAAPGLTEICGDGLDNDCDGSDEGCGRDGIIDPSAARARLVGAEGEGVGLAVDAADLDGDGLDDALLGAPGADGDRGALFVLSAPLVGTVSTGAADAQLRASADGQGLGEAVLGLDLDADGYGDMVAGLPGVNQVSWVAGPLRGALPVLPGDGDITGYDELGATLAGVVSEDGQRLVLLGDPGADGGGGEGSGLVAVLDGAWGAGASVGDLGALIGSEPGQGLGEALSPAGDVNGDGVLDALVAAPEAADGAGLVALALGPVEGVVSVADAAVSWVGPAAGAELGLGLAGGVDADNDGDDDVLIGAPGVADVGEDAGAAWLVSGGGDGLSPDLGAAVARLDGEAGARLGQTALALGRFDDDRKRDLAVGAPGLGACWVLYGPVEGALALADAELLLQGEASDGLAEGLGVGLVDGDEQADLLVGAPESALGGAGAGVVWVLTGSGW